MSEREIYIMKNDWKYPCLSCARDPGSRFDQEESAYETEKKKCIYQEYRIFMRINIGIHFSVMCLRAERRKDQSQGSDRTEI